MRKQTKALVDKTREELEKEIQKLVHEIAQSKMDQQLNPPKDTNWEQKKKKQIARLKTVLSTK